MKKIISILTTITLFVCMFSLTSNAAETPVFSLDKVSGKAGETVKLCLSISNNPGITSFRINLNFPTDELELKNIEYENLFTSPASGSDKFESPFTVSWFSTKSLDENNNGVVANIYFEIKDEATAGSYPIEITYSEDDVFNLSFTNIYFDTVDGVIDVESQHSHVLSYVPAKNATCNEDGNTAYYVCNDCDKWFEDENATVEITDHSSVVIKAAHTSSDWIIDKEATESETGSMHRECTVCKEILETKEIPVITPVQPSTKATNPTDTPSQDTTTVPATTSGNNGTSSDKKATPDSISNGAIATGAISATFIVLLIAVIAFAGIYIFSIKRKKMMNK